MDVGVLVLLATLAVAPTDPATRLSEKSFLDAAMQDERVRAVLDEPVAIARANRSRVGTLVNPDLSFDREALEGGPRQDTWSLSWVPPLDGRHWVQDRAAREGVKAAEQRQALTRVELRARLREAYAAWALTQDGAALGQRLAGLVDRLARRAQAQAARGEASVLASRRLLLAQIEVRAEAARLAAELAHARGRVRAWMPGLATDAAPVRPPLPPAQADTSMWAASPHIAALGHDVLQAEASASATGRFWSLPELSIGQQTLRGDVVDMEGPTYGVRWGLPLFDRRQGDRRESSARLAAARARRELDGARVREEFAAALTAYATLRESAALASAAEPVVERVLASAAAMFEAGESDVTDLLETLRGVLGGQIAALDSYGAALRAHRELEVAAGRPLPLTEGDER